MHRTGPLPVSGVEEVLAVSRRAAEVHLQHRVAAIGEPLHVAAITPGIARPRAAVYVQHHRQVLRLHADRQREIAVNGQSVAGLIRDRPHRSELILQQRRPRDEEEGAAFRQAVVRVVRRRTVVDEIGYDQAAAVRGAAEEADVAGVQLRERVEIALIGRIEYLPLGAVALKGDGCQLARLRVDERGADVVGRVRSDDGKPIVAQVVEQQPRRVRVDARRDVERTIIRAECDRRDLVVGRGLQERVPGRRRIGAHENRGRSVGIVLHGPANDEPVVLCPSADRSGILSIERRDAALQVDAVDVEDVGVALVRRDEHLIGKARIDGFDVRTHLVAERRDISRRARLDIRLIDVEIFVAALVLLVENVLAVGLPHDVADRAGGVGRDHVVVALADGAHPNREHPVRGREVREQLPVGRNSGRRFLRIPEEHRAGNERREIRARRGAAVTASAPSSAAAAAVRVLEAAIVTSSFLACVAMPGPVAVRRCPRGESPRESSRRRSRARPNGPARRARAGRSDRSRRTPCRA